jgi:hypothetical protein
VWHLEIHPHPAFATLTYSTQYLAALGFGEVHFFDLLDDPQTARNRSKMFELFPKPIYDLLKTIGIRISK